MKKVVSSRLSDNDSPRSSSRRAALARASRASSELDVALTQLRTEDDPEAIILVKRALAQVQAALQFLR